HRLPLGLVAVLGNQLLDAVAEILVERRGGAVVAAADVDLAVDRDPHIGQRAVGGGRIQPAPEAGVAVRRRRGRRGLLGRQIGGLRGGADEGERGGGTQQNYAQSSHRKSPVRYLAAPDAPM